MGRSEAIQNPVPRDDGSGQQVLPLQPCCVASVQLQRPSWTASQCPDRWANLGQRQDPPAQVLDQILSPPDQKTITTLGSHHINRHGELFLMLYNITPLTDLPNDGIVVGCLAERIQPACAESLPRQKRAQ